MTILIVSIYNTPEEIVSFAKIYEQNINKNVYFLNCLNSLNYCDINRDNELKKCFDCIIDRFFVFNLINVEDYKIINIDNKDYLNIEIPKFNNTNDLKKFKYNNVNFGLYTYNSISSVVGKIDFNIKYLRNAINNMIIQSINLYDKVSKILDEIKPEKVYIYKSDNLIYKPIEKLCLSKNIDTNIFYVNDNIIFIHNSKSEKIDSTIFIEKLNNEYLINGQKIKKTIFLIIYFTFSPKPKLILNELPGLPAIFPHPEHPYIRFLQP